MASYQVLFGAAVAMLMITDALGQYRAAPSYQEPQYKEQEYYAEPKYAFEYDIKDEHTGDYHSQKETRDGDLVQGYYSLVQPDGKKRIVEYTADHKTGFIANVHYEGEGKPYAPAPKYEQPKYAAPAYQAQPTYQKYEAPKYKRLAAAYKVPQYYY